MTAYREDVAEYGGGADPDDLYVANGYVGGRALGAVLAGMENPTGSGTMGAIDSLKPQRVPLLLDGIELRGGANGRLIHQYQIVRFDGESWEPEGEPIDSEELGLEE